MFALIGSCLADPTEDEDLRGLAGNTLLDFQRFEYRDTLLAFAPEQERKQRRDPLSPLAFSQDDVKAAFARTESTVEHYRRDWLDFYTPAAIARRQARWKEEAQRREQRDDPEADPFEDDRLDLMPLKPIVRGEPKGGRNDPCPCGSGKKFKKCCLAISSGSHAVASALFSGDDRASVLGKLRAFADQPEIVHELAEVAFEYWGPRFHSRPEAEQRRALELPQADVMRTAGSGFDADPAGTPSPISSWPRRGRSSRRESAFLNQAPRHLPGLV